MTRKTRLALAIAAVVTAACAAALYGGVLDKTMADTLRGHELALAAQLSDSKRPRDWVLAAELVRGDIGPDWVARTPAYRAAVAKAAAAAPDDALVQWLHAVGEFRQTDESAQADARTAARLAQSDPDNAVAWTLSLAVAQRSGDATRVDDALAHMAQASRYDEHDAEYLLEMMDAYASRPFPRLLLLTGTSARGFAFVNAFGRSVALDVPPYVPLKLACDEKRAQGDASRYDRCAVVARRMIGSDSSLARTMGYVVLRVSGRATADDAARLRQWQWQQSEYGRLIDEEIDGAAGLDRFADDWRETRSHIGVMLRMLERHGISAQAEPPADWTPPPAKSAERPADSNG